MSKDNNVVPISWYGCFIWLLAILFFLYEYCVRMIPATISEHIIKDLNINTEQFALISSAYYIAYSAMQIPVGILLDRFGVRLFLSLASIVCSLGVFGFSISDTFYDCIISRFLTGLGSSFGFIGLLVITLNWFPHNHFGFLGGLAQLLGATGPLLAGAPIIYLMQKTGNDWHSIFWNISFIGIILFFLIAIFVRNKPKANSGEIFFISKELPLKKALKNLIKITHFWFVLPYAGLIYVSLPLMGAYWGTLYLETRSFDPSTAALIVSMCWVGLAIGSPIIGRLSDHFKRRKPFLVILGVLGAIASFLIIMQPSQNSLVLSFLFFLLGFASSGQSLSFATIVEQVPSELKATAMGANNTAIMLLAAFLPPAITIFIHPSGADHPHFITSDFTISFLTMPLCYLLASLIALFCIKETFCRQQNTVHYLSN